MKRQGQARRSRAVVMLEMVIAIALLLPISLLAFDVAALKIATAEVEASLHTAAMRTAQLDGGINEQCGAQRCFEATFDAQMNEAISRHVMDTADVTVTSGSATRCYWPEDRIALSATFRTKAWSRLLMSTLTGTSEHTVHTSTSCLIRGER